MKDLAKLEKLFNRMGVMAITSKLADGGDEVIVGDTTAGISFRFTEEGVYSHWVLYHDVSPGLD